MSIVEALLIAGFTGAFSSITTIAALKIEIKWMKDTVIALEKRIEKRLDNHGQRLFNIEREKVCQN